jgi:hypothetical protein
MLLTFYGHILLQWQTSKQENRYVVYLTTAVNYRCKLFCKISHRNMHAITAFVYIATVVVHSSKLILYNIVLNIL